VPTFTRRTTPDPRLKTPDPDTRTRAPAARTSPLCLTSDVSHPTRATRRHPMTWRLFALRYGTRHTPCRMRCTNGREEPARTRVNPTHARTRAVRGVPSGCRRRRANRRRECKRSGGTPSVRPAAPSTWRRHAAQESIYMRPNRGRHDSRDPTHFLARGSFAPSARSILEMT